MTRVAAVDCGTNSVKLLIAGLDPATGEEQVLLRQGWMTRLGQGVDATGRFDPAALERTLAALDEIAEHVRDHGVGPDRTRMVATSAARDAANGDELVQGVRERLGVDPDIATGEEEAALSFDGATRSLADLLEGATVLVVDVGGGSTELVLGTVGEVQQSVSLDIGSVRLTERVLHDDPPSERRCDEARVWVRELLDDAPVGLGRADLVVGVAGTVTTLAAVALGHEEYDHDRLHRVRLDADDVAGTTSRLLAMTTEERRGLGAMHPGRADVIAAGALVVDEVLRASGARELVVSGADVIDGIAWSLVGRE